MKNFLKYSGLTYDSLISQITDKLNSDERFANFRESAISQMLIEIFAGTVDLVNYYLERRVEESFFDTARLRSSVMLLARSLGYVIQRPVPAEATLKMKLKGSSTDFGLNAGDTIQVPVLSVFTYNGLKFILKNKVTLIYGDYQDEIVASSETSFITRDADGNSIDIVQGEIKEKFIDGNTNPQLGSTFQIYRIDDTEFSNRYGDEDFTYPVTKVWVGDVKSDETSYDINRRSLIDWKVINSMGEADEIQRVCVIRTSMTDGVELLFGDGRFAEMGARVSAVPETSNDNIYIQYLATKGAEANQVGVKDKKVQFAGKVFDSNGRDITSRVEFYFDTNIVGGADVEDIDSIRINAPNIYYTLDRLVSKDDYVNYLESLTSPINVKNAIAWGEQEELRERGLDAMIRMFNIVFFSIVGSLYQTENSPYYMKTKSTGLDTAVLDYGYDDDSLNQRNYFNVFTKGYIPDTSNLVEQLSEYQTCAFTWRLLGDEVSHDYVYFNTHYGTSGFILKVNYGTDVVSYNTSLTGTVNVSVPAAGTITTMTSFATAIQNALTAVNDERGYSTINNANRGNPAFPGLVVNYDDQTLKFEINHADDTPCYITSIENINSTNSAASDVGLTQSISAVLVGVNKELSKKIVDVVDDLDSRSQVTIRNIYISPIIQTMKLIGKVYLNDLYDKQTEKTTIEDAIYKWFDNNADFNKDVYISNVIELIEQYPSVKYADVRFVPDYPISPSGSFYYVVESRYLNLNYEYFVRYILGHTHPSIEKSFTSVVEKTQTYYYIDVAIHNFISASNKSDTSGTNEKDLNYFNRSVQSYSYNWNNTITERTFLEVFAKGLYNTLKGYGGNYSTFADSDNFMNLISDIRKDYLPIIRYNLLDTKGNISRDEQTDSSGKTIKGGYSLGCEIVKVNIQLSYEYKR